MISEQINNLSQDVKAALATRLSKQPLMDDSLLSRITSFNREVTEIKSVPKSTGADAGKENEKHLTMLRRDIEAAVDRLEVMIKDVLQDRSETEKKVMRWIWISGVIIILLLLYSLVAPFLGKENDKVWISQLLSGISLSGFLYLIFSPARKALAIANDRTNLMLIPSVIRIRFLTAVTREELKEVADDLSKIMKLA